MNNLFNYFIKKNKKNEEGTPEKIILKNGCKCDPLFLKKQRRVYIRIYKILLGKV